MVHFNSHTREGVTKRFPRNILYMPYFNSHTREGVTDKQNKRLTNDKYFNSHTREGVTIAAVHFIKCIMISTHTPVRV